jgi:hypothetical protein
MPSYRIFHSVRPNMLKILYSKPQMKQSHKLKTSDFVFSPFPNKCVKPIPFVSNETVKPN